MGVINFPKVPQTLKLYSKVASGTRFIFSGKCNTKNFSIALISTSEIALFLEFTFEDVHLVSAKSFSNMKWSSEKIQKNPLQENGDFFIQVIALRHHFEVFLGGTFLLSLKYAIPLDEITGIRVMESMELYKVEMMQP